MSKTPLITLMIVAFLLNSFGFFPVYANELVLPAPGVMVHLSPEFNPAVLKGVTVHPDNPFKFEFILDRGESQLSNEALKDESKKLVKYFLSAITTPEKDLWVNLSPYEKQRIVPESFGQTDMGRDLLAQDYMLKQITASLIYPEDEVGKQFWKRVYEEAAKKFGKTNIPVNTFNKVWIVPDHAKVYEHGNTAFVVKANLKVMLEEDYLALEKVGVIAGRAKQSYKINPSSISDAHNDTSSLGSQIVREIVIPQLEKEVNEGKNFSKLRQVYNSLILATWFKKRMKDSVLGRKYMDQNKVAGIDIDDKDSKQRIYEQYIKSFKKGVYNYIKEEPETITGEMIPRKYFSGGFAVPRDFAMHSIDFAQTISPEEVGISNPDQARVILANENSPRYVERNSETALAVSEKDDNVQSSEVADRAMNIKEIKRDTPEYVNHFDQLAGYINGGPKIVRRFIEKNERSFVFSSEVSGQQREAHVIWNHTERHAWFGWPIDNDLWSQWGAEEQLITRASQMLVEILNDATRFYSWRDIPHGFVINEQGRGDIALEVGGFMGININFKQMMMLMLPALKSGDQRYINNVRKFFTAEIIHELTHLEREETGQIDQTFGKALPSIGEEIASHLTAFLYDPWDNKAGYVSLKSSLDGFQASKLAGKSIATVADVYNEARYRALLIVAHELARYDSNYREIFIKDSNKYKINAIKRMIGSREVLTPHDYDYLSKDFVRKIMSIPQEKLYELSDKIMQDPNNFDLAQLSEADQAMKAQLENGLVEIGDEAMSVRAVLKSYKSRLASAITMSLMMGGILGSGELLTQDYVHNPTRTLLWMALFRSMFLGGSEILIKLYNETKKGRFVSTVRGVNNSLEIHISRNLGVLQSKRKIAMTMIVNDVKDVIQEVLGDHDRRFQEIQTIVIDSPLIVRDAKKGQSARFMTEVQRWMNALGIQGEVYKRSKLHRFNFMLRKLMSPSWRLKNKIYSGKFTIDVSTPKVRKEILERIKSYQKMLDDKKNDREKTNHEKNGDPLSNPGGIDLTTDRMKLDIEKDKAQLSQPMDLKALENIEINELYIKDIAIKPLNNLPQFLGIYQK